MLISVGERVACALAAMAIHDLGHEAISLTGSQAGIVTDTVHGRAKIVDVRARRIHEALDADRIVLVAGFQGVSTSYDVTTWAGRLEPDGSRARRGLGADACEMYTDVEGVFTADPTPRADGAQAARGQLRGDAGDGRVGRESAPATLGRARAQPRRQASRTFQLQRRGRHLDPGGGRTDAREGDHLRRHAFAGGGGVSRRRRGALAAFEALSDEGLSVDTILQTGADIVFSGPISDAADTSAALDRLGVSWSSRNDLGQVSVIGAGMKTHPGVAGRTFATLGELGIEPEIVNTSPIKISFRRPRPGRGRGARAPQRLRAGRRGGRPCPRLTPASASSAPRASSEPSLWSCSPSAGLRRPGVRVLPLGGSEVDYGGRSLRVEEATPERLAGDGLDLCFFSVGTGPSSELVPPTAGAGTTCIDKSDAFRLAEGIPLVVAGVNDDAIDGGRIVANPNCSAIQLSCVLKPLHDAAGLRQVRLATYQSMSGAGDAGVDACGPSRRCRPISRWTGRSRATSSTRSTSYARRPGRFSVCPTCRSRRPASASRCSWVTARRSGSRRKIG